MAVITKEEFLENLYQIFLKTNDLQAFAEARVAEEQALVAEFRINEANASRAALVEKYKGLEAPLRTEIDDLKKQTETKG